MYPQTATCVLSHCSLILYSRQPPSASGSFDEGASPREKEPMPTCSAATLLRLSSHGRIHPHSTAHLHYRLPRQEANVIFVLHETGAGGLL